MSALREDEHPEQIQQPKQPSRTGAIDWKRLIPGVLISLAAVVIILLIVDPKKVMVELGRADLRWITASVLSSILWLVARAFFWRTLLQDKASLRSVFFTVNEGYLLNYILPFRLGEIGRAVLLSRKSEIKFWQIIPTIIIERILDLGMAMVIFIGSISFVVKGDSSLTVAILMALAVTVGLLVLFLMARQPQFVRSLIQRLTGRIPRLKTLVDSQLNVFLEGLAILADGRLFLAAVGWLLVNWSISILQVTFLLHAFFPDAQVLWSFFILGCVALGNAAPSTPGAIGVVEGAITGALAFFKVDPNTALAYALATRLFSYLTSGVLGGFALSQEKIGLGALFASLYRRSKGEE